MTEPLTEEQIRIAEINLRNLVGGELARNQVSAICALALSTLAPAGEVAVRYEIEQEPGLSYMKPSADGGYVLFTDYAALQAKLAEAEVELMHARRWNAENKAEIKAQADRYEGATARAEAAEARVRELGIAHKEQLHAYGCDWWANDRLCTCAKSTPPKATDGLRAEVVAFAAMMETQLKRNDSRGGWKGMKPGYLHERIRQNEVDLGTYRAEKNWAAYGRTCADIANFAMMLADNAQALSSPSKEHHD